jgi:hypothetical protein
VEECEVMKQETIDILRKGLNKDKKFEEQFDNNKDFVYKIESVPVLTKRDKQGILQEVTNYNYGLLFRSEKEK